MDNNIINPSSAVQAAEIAKHYPPGMADMAMGLSGALLIFAVECSRKRQELGEDAPDGEVMREMSALLKETLAGCIAFLYRDCPIELARHCLTGAEVAQLQRALSESLGDATH